jgi:hypothetical protein
MIPLLLSGQLNCGYNKVNNFSTPTENNKKNTAYWWTNMEVDKPSIPLKVPFDKRIHRTYDNYNAINCDFVALIPNNYDGAIGVPISIMPYLNTKQFNINDVLINPFVEGEKKMSRIIISKKG